MTTDPTPSHADGHRCTCEMTDLGVYHGDNMHPPEWEQDPWCPTHPDMTYVIDEHQRALAERDEQRNRAEVAERQVQAVRDLFSGGPETPCRTVWQEFPGLLGETFRVECVEVPMDDLRAALAPLHPDAPTGHDGQGDSDTHQADTEAGDGR